MIRYAERLWATVRSGSISSNNIRNPAGASEDGPPVSGCSTYLPATNLGCRRRRLSGLTPASTSEQQFPPPGNPDRSDEPGSQGEQAGGFWSRRGRGRAGDSCREIQTLLRIWIYCINVEPVCPRGKKRGNVSVSEDVRNRAATSGVEGVVNTQVPPRRGCLSNPAGQSRSCRRRH